MITSRVRTGLLLSVTLVLSGTTQIQAEVYSSPRDFGWRKSVPLHLILDSAVVVDLGLNDEAAGKIKDLQNRIQKELEEELAKGQAKPSSPIIHRNPEILHAIRSRHSKEINDLLSPSQQTRLHQIHLQNSEFPTDARLFGRGPILRKEETDVLSDSAVAKELALTDTQRREIASIHSAITRAEGGLVKKSKQVGPYYRDLMRESPAKIMKVLTEPQREALSKLVGNRLKLNPSK